MKVIVINEENHGCLGVARDYQSAVQWLIDKGWIYGCLGIWSDREQKEITVKDELGVYWEDHILSWDIDNFNYIFNDFYLSETTLIEMPSVK